MRMFRPATCAHGLRRARGFTLIEMMVVVAIIGLMAAIGVPSLITTMQKRGMRKALNDIQDVCRTARSNAIIHNHTESVVFHPSQGTFAAEGGAATHSGLVSSSSLPDGVTLEMLDINQQDYLNSDPARIFFYPDGTSDEAKIVIADRNMTRMITLEFATGFTSVSPVQR